MGRFKVADELLGLWVNIFLSAPLTALVPVIMILFGFGQTTIIVTVVLFAIWIIVLDTRAGVRHVSPSLVEMARSFGATPVQLYGKILLLAALPEILTGIRLGVIRGVKGVVIGQLLVSIVGLGELFELYSRSFLIEAVLGADADPVRRSPSCSPRAVAALERRVELFRRRARLSRGHRDFKEIGRWINRRRGCDPLRHPAAAARRPCRSRARPGLFPVRRVYCVGRNYAEHAREMGHDPDREEPFFFQKPRRRAGDRRPLPLSAGDQGRASRDRAGRGAGQGRPRHPGRAGARTASGAMPSAST